MFSEKSSDSSLGLWGFGVLSLLILISSMVGCSSRAPETDKLYSSGEPGSINGQEATLSSDPSKQPAAANARLAPVISAPKPSYTQADREVVLRYAEMGENDTANLEQALKLIQRAEQRTHTERTMEDYLVLAAHYWFKEDMQQVVQHANQGIMTKSDSKRVKAHMFIYLGYTYEKKSLAMAGSYFKQAAQIDPGFYKGEYELGRILFDKKEYSVAKVALKKAFDLNPESADVYGMLGQMFNSMDLYEEAAESLEKALAMSPQTHWIHLKLGDIYFYGLKKREEGGRHYQEAVSKSDSDPETHFGLALFYRYKNEYDKAEMHLQKAMTLDHKNPKYKRELDSTRSERIEMAKEIQKYKQTIAKSPGNPSPVARLGGYYLRWGKYDKAEEQYKKAVQLAVKMDESPVAKPNPSNPDEPAVREPSQVPEYANKLGWFYYNDKNYSEAEQAFKQAIKANPKHTPAQFGLGRTYESLQQYDLAASQYSIAAALDPENQEAQKHLTALKESGKLIPVGEVIETQEVKPGKSPVVEVKK